MFFHNLVIRVKGPPEHFLQVAFLFPSKWRNATSATGGRAAPELLAQ